MKNTIRLQEEISQNISCKKHITTKIEYFTENKNDTKTLCDNITRVMCKYLSSSNLAKITYDTYPSEGKVVVEIIEHVG